MGEICLSLCISGRRIWNKWKNIGFMSRKFANGLGDWGSILDRVTLKIFKIVLDTALLNTQHYKVRIKGIVEQSSERSSDLTYTSV